MRGGIPVVKRSTNYSNRCLAVAYPANNYHSFILKSREIFTLFTNMFKTVIDTYRRSFTGLSTEIWWLSLVLLINRSGTMVAPFITIYLTQHLHYSLIQATVVNAMLGLGAVAGALAGGKLTDNIGFTWVQLTALAGGGVLFILLGYIEHFSTICIVAFLLSLVNDAFRPANSAAIAAYSLPENRTRSYTLNRLAINIGWAVGASAGGILAGINYRLLFWVDGVTNLMAAVVLWWVLFRPRQQKAIKEKVLEVLPATSPWKDKVYIRFIILVTLFASCFMLMFRIVPVFYKEQLHLPEAVIGLIMGLNGVIIAFFEMVLIARWEGKRSHLVYIRYGLYLGAITFLILLLPANGFFIALFSMVVFTFSEILALPFMNTFWINRANEYNRGSYAAVYTISWSVAQIAGPYIGAVVVDHFNYNVLWLCACVVSALCGLGVYFLYDKKQAAGDNIIVQ
jgi:predicted MFS family arabinose efflux permease